jgi:hypothetical protein
MTTTPNRPPTRVEDFSARGIWIVLACVVFIVAIAALAVWTDGPPRRCLEPRVTVEWWSGPHGLPLRPIERTACDRWAP